MTRTSTSPLGATATVAVLMVGVPIWILTRLTNSPLSFGAFDLVLGCAIVAWVLVAKAIIGRDEAVDSRTINRTSPAWQAHQLVDRSVFGVGYVSSETSEMTTSHLGQVSAPRELTPDQLPAPLHGVQIAQGRDGLGEAGTYAVPTLHSDEAAALSVHETEEYIVARGDTFWSIAEVVLGDGREWQQLQALNLGREVAPGVMLDANHELRIGWSVLLPLIADATPEGAISA